MIRCTIKLLSKIFKPKLLNVLDINKIANTTKDKKDSRDYIYTSKIIDVSEKYVIPDMPPIRNQGRISSCASHAVIANFEIHLRVKSIRAYIEGSELFHYYFARVEAGTFPYDTGMTIRQACSTIKKYGMALEFTWPYDVTRHNVKPNWLCNLMATYYKVKSYERLYSLEDIKQCIFNHVPIMCGIYILENFYSVSRYNNIYMPTGLNKGGHAVNIVGYDDVKKMFLFRNSWGINFGDKGYFKMSYKDFIKYSFDWWKITPLY